MEGSPPIPEPLSEHLNGNRSKMKKSTDFWVVVSLLVMVFSLAWLYHVLHRTKLNPPKPIPIVSAPATTDNIPVYRSALGTVTPVANVLIRSQVNGILQRLLFTDGQLVKQGQILAQIDSRPYQALLEQYEGNLKRDKALLTNAKVDLKRYQRLLHQDSISDQTYVTQKALVQQYEGAVKTDKGLIDSTIISLEYCNITSPIDGRIGLHLVDPGNFIQTTDVTGLAVVNTISPINVVFSLPEEDIPELIPNKEIPKNLLVEAYDKQETKRLAQGSLLTIDNQIDPTTGTIKLKAVFANKDNSLYPNQFVNVKILVSIIKNAVVVPTSAIQHSLTSDYVYILHGKNVHMQEVKVSYAYKDESVIEKGVSQGDLVVIDGADKLVHGARIIDESQNEQASSTS